MLPPTTGFLAFRPASVDSARNRRYEIDFASHAPIDTLSLRNKENRSLPSVHLATMRCAQRQCEQCIPKK